MSRGLGSMQKAILTALESKGGTARSKDLMYCVGTDFEAHGRYVRMDLSHPTYGALWCWTNSFYISFYRALNGLQERGLITWDKGMGGLGSYDGKISFCVPV